MKILICGLGSIGQRHAKNLIHLKQDNLIFFRERNLKLTDKKLKNKKVFYSLDEALKDKPTIAFICNTTEKHIDTALKCAKKNCHLFIEKPLSHNLKKIKKLKKIALKNKIKIMIGYNMRFHPLMVKIKKFLKKGFLGKVYNFQSEWSEYLPDWHPWEDYKNTYPARKEMGGGCSLTLSHELDSLCWLFGNIKKMYNFKIYDHLDTNVDTCSDFLINFNNKVVGYSHIDFLGKPYTRKLFISGTKRKIFFDYYKNQIKIFERTGSIKVIKVKFKKNDMYLNEIDYFLKCILKNKNPVSNLKDSQYILKKILSFK